MITDVLVVDDDDATHKTLTKMLERAGFMVTAADNGLAAVAELGQQRVGAIVSDIQMPFLKAGRFYDELSSNHPALAERVIFVTGHGGDEHVRELARPSGRPVIHKPVNISELVSSVRVIVDRNVNSSA